jgi:predicted aconitase with swiveling domain
MVMARGVGSGKLLKLEEPLSFWGGIDLSSGAIVDSTHPQRGRSVAGSILAMPSARGSSSSSSALAEAVRAGTAPRAILLGVPDNILMIGSIVAADLYGIAVPLVVVSPSAWRTLKDGEELMVFADLDSAQVPHSQRGENKINRNVRRARIVASS